MNIDILTVGAGVASFTIFLIIKVITFRWLRPEELLRSLAACLFAIALLPVVLMVILYVIKAVDLSVPAWILASLMALLINGLLSFVYIVCIFGPYETSIRMRLVREIARGGSRGVSLQEISERYNPQMMVDIRLRRLLGSGDVIEQDGRYKIGRSQNFFFVFDSIARVIKKWIGR